MIKLPFGLRVAKRASKRSNHPKKPMGCAYVEGSVIVSAPNTLKTNPRAFQMGYPEGRTHAEFAVIKTLNTWSRKTGTIFVYRETKNGMPALARPCEICINLIKTLGINTICYSTTLGFSTERIN